MHDSNYSAYPAGRYYGDPEHGKVVRGIDDRYYGNPEKGQVYAASQEPYLIEPAVFTRSRYNDRGLWLLVGLPACCCLIIFVFVIIFIFFMYNGFGYGRGWGRGYYSNGWW